MEQATVSSEAPVAIPRRRRSDFVIAVAGVLVVPAALVLVANSWTAPETADYIRMAFAQVAATTIACSTLIGLAIAAFGSGRRSAASGWLLAAGVAILLATSAIVSAAGWLARAVS
jgi:peptidoglycan/LPS O-acetylase OafA/YrhL